MAKDRADGLLSAEEIEADQKLIAQADAGVVHETPESVEPGSSEITSPEIYADTDPSIGVPEVYDGDPGTYAGDYEPLWKSEQNEEQFRDTLPDGHIPPEDAQENIAL